VKCHFLNGGGGLGRYLIDLGGGKWQLLPSFWENELDIIRN